MEHTFTMQWGNVAALQMLFVATLLFPGIAGRGDSFRAFIGTVASYVVSFAPMALLIYLLYAVSRFN
ncbi:MAG TPA: hypothetical protein VN328_07310 [Thermodesulfovibrionales bacterium]|jgi:hypothetical protein|nr:hypothetical protein [Thermodesulfovibrionales bacterium]